MNIISCFKLVPEEQDIVVRSDNTLSFERAEWKISLYDLNAIEAGVKLSEETGNVSVVLTIGGKAVENSKLKKAALARGPAELYAVMDEGLETADSYATAEVLATAIKKIGNVSIVLCGEGSGDLYAQQVGPVLGHMLGFVSLNAVSKITILGEKMIVERALEDEVEVLEVDLPAVISVTTDINTPRITGLKEILAAGKKPVTTWSLSDLGVELNCKTQIVSTLAPPAMGRKNIIIEGDSEDKVDELYEHLRKVL